MKLLLTISLLLSLLVIMVAPVMSCHHDDDATTHAEADCDCGCICHVSVHAIPAAEILDTDLLPSDTALSYIHPRLEPLYSSLDRPPELLS